jgi:hypothetical protein
MKCTENRRVHHAAFIAATLSSVGLLIGLPASASAQVGFDFGIFDNGALGLRNASLTSVTLNSFTVTFTAPNPTFFDTAPTSPGTGSSTGFNVFYNTGIAAVTLPGDAATDGQQTATFSFSGFDPNEVVGISFDLDAFNNGLTGSPTGGLVSAVFSNGETLNGIIGSSQFFVPTFDTFDRGVSVRSASVVPEPSAYLIGAAFVSVLGLGVFRGRRRRISA